MGGAFFVMDGGSISFGGALNVAGNRVAGGGSASAAGGAFGAGLFLAGNGTLAFQPGDGATQIVSDAIVDEAGAVANGTVPPAGFVPGSYSVTINGTGTLLLNAINAYTGGTTVASGTLGGNGAIGDLTVQSGGHVAPGNSPGILSTGSFTLDAGAFFDAEITGTTVGTQYDQLRVTGSVTLHGTLNLLFGAYVPTTGAAFKIIDNDGVADAVIGTFEGLAEDALFHVAGGSYAIDYHGGDGNDVVLTLLDDANDAPTDIALAGASVAENSAAGTTVGTLGAADPDAGDTFTFTLVAGSGSEDNALFQIVGNEIQVAPDAVLDFEQDSSHSLRVRTTDAGGLFFEKVFTITVTNQNEASVANDDAAAITEDGPPNPVSGNVLVNDTDADGDWLNVTNTGTFALTYGTLVLSADGSYVYTLDNAKAAVQELKAGEAVTDEFAYTISDGKGATDSADLTITITGTNDAPELSGDSAITVAEGSSVVIATADLAATDPDNADEQLAFTVTVASHGAVLLSGAPRRPSRRTISSTIA